MFSRGLSHEGYLLRDGRVARRSGRVDLDLSLGRSNGFPSLRSVEHCRGPEIRVY